MSTVVHVKGISSQTSEKEVRDFFSFCGKISDLSVTEEGDTKSAKVTFEKETAAKTALLLDNTQLGPAQVQVTSATGGTSTSTTKDTDHHDEHEVAQEDKPRSRILAEYLAHGYVISDQVIQRGLALDQQHGISNKFLNTLKGFEDKYKVTDKSRAVDDKYNVSSRAGAAWSGLSSYYDKAIGTPTGQKLRQFYEQGTKQVMDVHNEARHLANLKAGKSANNPPVPVEGDSSRTTCKCSADTGKCSCAPGTCACSSCAKNPEVKSSVSVEEAQMEKVGDSDRTKCNCGATAEKCPCPPGKCACNKCAKNPESIEQVPGTSKTTCNCGSTAANCPCEPGKCACSNCAK